MTQHAGFLRAVSRRMLLQPGDQDDAVQEAWLAALQRPPEAGPGLKGWFATVIRNEAREQHRRRTRRARREAVAAKPEAQADTAHLVQRAETLRRLAAALADLPAVQRDVLLLRYFEGLPPREIARRLDAPVATIKSRHHRALAALRARLDDEDEDRGAAWRAALMPVAGLAWPDAPPVAEATAGAGVWQGVLAGIGATVAVGLVVFALSRGPSEPAVAATPEAPTKTLAAASEPAAKSPAPRSRTRVFVYASSHAASRAFASSSSQPAERAPPADAPVPPELEKRLTDPLPPQRFEDAPAVNAMEFVSRATGLPLELPPALEAELRRTRIDLDTEGRSARDVLEALLPADRWVAVATPAGLTFRDAAPR